MYPDFSPEVNVLIGGVMAVAFFFIGLALLSEFTVWLYQALTAIPKAWSDFWKKFDSINDH